LLNDQMERFDEEEERVINLTEEKKKLLKDIQDLEDRYVTTCRKKLFKALGKSLTGQVCFQLTHRHY